ncbi:NAD(P)/FAD-dependent oxidoreductase [Streptomyces sp. NPDC059989]|uniref:NAD(P)/FAD-dependent oxidoreductase n=1 Tax=Streptomyces sp. NPDC059989 TaxID=3347026 RepID=UPI0036D0B49F
MSSTVVVVGGGYGGTTVAKTLDEVAEVILVEQKDSFVHNVAALRGVVDPAWSERLFLSYDGLLSRGRIVHARAERVEPGSVTLSTGERIEADFVVLATGSTYPFPAKFDIDDAAGAKARLAETRTALQAADSVLLLGAGPVGLEFAGEIRAAWPEKRITIVDPASDVIVGDFPDELRAEVRRQLEELGVEIVLGASLVEEPPAEPGRAKTFTAKLTTGAEVTADIWFRCFGAAPATDCLGAGLAANRQSGGLVEVRDTLQLPGQERVFALGDVTSIPEAKKAKAAEDHAVVIANNIRKLIAGETELETYRAGGPMIALSLGPNGGAGFIPERGVLGAEMVSRAKSADLRTTFYEELLGVVRPAADQG